MTREKLHAHFLPFQFASTDYIINSASLGIHYCIPRHYTSDYFGAQPAARIEIISRRRHVDADKLKARSPLLPLARRRQSAPRLRLLYTELLLLLLQQNTPERERERFSAVKKKNNERRSRLLLGAGKIRENRERVELARAFAARVLELRRGALDLWDFESIGRVCPERRSLVLLLNLFIETEFGGSKNSHWGSIASPG